MLDGARDRMVGAEYPGAVSESVRVLADRILALTRQLVGEGKVVPGGEGVRVAGAQYPLAVGEQLFVRGDRLLVTSRCRIDIGEVVAGRERFGVIGASPPVRACAALRHGGEQTPYESKPTRR